MVMLLMAIVVGALLFLYRIGTGVVARGGRRVTERTDAAVAKTRARLGKLRLFRGRDRRFEGPFRDWIGTAELDRRATIYKSLPSDAARFTAWVQGLGDDDLRAFVQDLSDFCDRRGLDLGWLVDPSLTGELKQRMEEAVGLYCLSAWKSRELQPFATYRAWLADPLDEKNRVFASGLFSRLVTVGLVTPSHDQWSASERERRAFAAKSMETVAVQDPRTFAALLRDTAAGDSTALGAP